MKTRNARTLSIFRIMVIVLDAVGLLLGVEFTAFLITGVVYPVKLADQQLLKSWGIEPIFIAMVWFEYLLPLVLAIPVTYKLIRKVEKWSLISTLMFIILFGFMGVIDSLMGFFGTPIVVKNMVRYPFVGWFVGQAMGTAIAALLAWKRKSNIKVPLPPPTI